MEYRSSRRAGVALNFSGGRQSRHPIAHGRYNHRRYHGA